MWVDLRLEVTQLHVELLAFQLVTNDFFLIFLTLIVENQDNGESGDEPNEPHHENHETDTKIENLGKGTLGDEVQQTDVNSRGNNSPKWNDKNGKQDEKHHLAPLQEMLNQHLINKDHQKHLDSHKAQRTDGAEQEVAVGMHCEENDKQRNPDDAVLVEALQQVEIGGRQVWQRWPFHILDFHAAKIRRLGQCRNAFQRNLGKCQ